MTPTFWQAASTAGATSAKSHSAGVRSGLLMNSSSGATPEMPTYEPMFSEPVKNTSSEGSLADSWSGIFWSCAATGCWT